MTLTNIKTKLVKVSYNEGLTVLDIETTHVYWEYYMWDYNNNPPPCNHVIRWQVMAIQTQHINPMLSQLWVSVVDDDP